ncbi:MAG: PIN domain-containing protein [Chloroflexi bacterium]|nr:PIN domain-containing protein [Chloroflexota bacterium]
MILVDASCLIASYDRKDPHHVAVRRVLSASTPRVLSPFVLAEADYLIAEMAGQSVELAVLNDVALGAFQLASFDRADVAAATAVIERYADLRLGLADASIVVLADRYRCQDVLTLDQRHFRALRDSAGRAFRLFPWDAP